MALRRTGIASTGQRLAKVLATEARSVEDVAVPGVELEIWQTARASSSWVITEARLRQVTLLSGRMAAPYAATIGTQAASIFVLCAGGPWLINGCTVKPGELSLFVPGADADVASMAQCTWLGVQVVPDILQRYTTAFNGKPVDLQPGVTSLGRLDPGQLKSMQALSTVVSQAGDRERLQQQLLLLLSRGVRAESAPLRSGHERIARKAMAYLQEHNEAVILTAELCLAIGISDRWLREAFLRVYGVTATQLLRLRRLHLARKALLSAPGSVTQVAAEHGFFDFGRFAMSYRRLFGELPSQTCAVKSQIHQSC